LKVIDCQACCSDVAIVDVEGEWVCRACILAMQDEPQDVVDLSFQWTNHSLIVDSSDFDVEDGLILSLRSEYDVIKTVDVRRWWLRWLFKTPKYKLFGLMRHVYEWAEISNEQWLKLLQPGRMQSLYAGTAWTLWFGSDRQFRQQFVGTALSGLASLINRSDAASRYGVLTNAVGNTTHGVVSYINHSLALVQIAPDVVGGVYGHQVEGLVVGDIIEVGIESVESPKEIQLQIVKEMKKK